MINSNFSLELTSIFSCLALICSYNSKVLKKDYFSIRLFISLVISFSMSAGEILTLVVNCINFEVNEIIFMNVMAFIIFYLLCTLSFRMLYENDKNSKKEIL